MFVRTLAEATLTACPPDPLLVRVTLPELKLRYSELEWQR
jgi:hypothetical protein